MHKPINQHNINAEIIIMRLTFYQITAHRKQVRPSSGTGVYQHMPILRPHVARFHEQRISSAACGPRSH